MDERGSSDKAVLELRRQSLLYAIGGSQTPESIEVVSGGVIGVQFKGPPEFGFGFAETVHVH